MRKSGTSKKKTESLNRIHRRIFMSQVALIVALALFLGVAGVLINIEHETTKRDENLQNVAETIARSPFMKQVAEKGENEAEIRDLSEYLNALKESLSDIDVLSVVRMSDRKRLYHSNPDLLGTEYDGTVPEFKRNEKEYYATTDRGPSGTQRRAYAAVYNEKGECVGFVMAITLMTTVQAGTLRIFMVFGIITVAAVLMELIISMEISRNIKKKLNGYEPDVFSAMYRVRDDILGSLAEGVIAVDKMGKLQFINEAAARMLSVENGGIGTEDQEPENGKNVKELLDAFRDYTVEELCGVDIFRKTLESGEQSLSVREKRFKNPNVLLDTVAMKDGNEIIGAVAILHDRAEYTKLMEDLTGTRYLVDSMRANNHDFTNKLHVILGLIQMGLYDRATNYIENISMVQRSTISKIMQNVNEPAVAALLIGKAARASELNIRFILREGFSYNDSDCPLPREVLITIIGNLIDNAFDAMNGDETANKPKELLFGIFSKPGALLITIDDTGVGIPEGSREKIFENGYSTKGTGRGTGLYTVKKAVEGLNGRILVESQEGVGTSFCVTFTKEEYHV